MTTPVNTFNRQENIAHEAIQIFKTLALLDQAYSSSYLVRILQADERYKFRKIAHQQLETYGSLEGLPFSRLSDIIYYLEGKGFMEIKNSLYGTMVLSDMGREYLQDPQDMEVNRQDLFRNWAQIQLSIGLRSIRKDYAERSGRPPFELFTNYVLETLARQMPGTPPELDQVPGMKNLSEELRQLILEEINRIKALQSKNLETDGSIAKSFSPGHRKIKELFENEFGVEEIARRRNLKPSTVRSYLADLYEAGSIDLAPWIEREVEAMALHKGAEYFRTASSPQIDEARKVLGYDFDVLRLCKAYAFRAEEENVGYAA